MTKIHCLNPITKCGTELFPTGYGMTDNVMDADTVLVRSASIHDMELPENLLAAGRAGTGVNSIPLDSCMQRNAVMFDTPGTNANGVKGLVIADMLMASWNIVSGIEWCKANAEDGNITKDTEKSKKAFAGYETKGRKLGVIGLRATGAEVANATTHLGVEVYGYDPYASVNVVWRLSRNIKHITNAGTTFQKCDYITVHVPLMDSTRGMINKERLAIVRGGVVILNFSRDALASDDDMAVALDTGRVRYYISDFPSPKVANMERVILLPHLDAPTKESGDNCVVIAMKELVDYLENGDIKNSVNFPSCDMGICRAESRMIVLHMNISNMTGQITAILAEQGMNISDITSESRDKCTYTLLDLEYEVGDSTIQKLRAIKGVLRVRVVEQPHFTMDGL